MSTDTAKLEELASQVRLLSPVDKVRLIERIMPALEQELMTPQSTQDNLSAWAEVYAGLSDKEIMEVERLSLDRSHFMKQDA